MPSRPTLLIDFDGTLYTYYGWSGPEVFGPPLPKARAAMYSLEKTYRLVCFTTRPTKPVYRWLSTHGFPPMKVTNIKEPAFLIIDDRAITFTGEWTDSLLTQIKAFTPHWKKGGASASDSERNQSDPQSAET